MSRTADTTPPAAPGRRSVLHLLVGGGLIVAAGGVGWALARRGGGAVSFGSLLNYAFVQAANGGPISVVDTRNDELVGVLGAPETAGPLLVSAPLSRLILPLAAEGSVALYDIEADATEAMIALDLTPDSMNVSPDGYLLVAADSAAGRVAVVNLAEKRLVSTLDGFVNPGNIAFSSDSGYAFIPEPSTSRIRVINAFSGAESEAIPLSIGGPTEEFSALTRTPNGVYGMVVGREAGEMAVIQFRGALEYKKLAVGGNPTRPYGTADGQYVMVASNDDRTLSIYSTAYFDLQAKIPAPADVTSIATGYFETLAYIVSSSEKKAMVVDLEHMEQVAEVAFPGVPGPAVVDADGKKLYVAMTDTGEMAVVDVFERKVLTTVPGVGPNPYQATLAVTNNYCH